MITGFISLAFLFQVHAKSVAVQFPTRDGSQLRAKIFEPEASKKLSPIVLIIEGSGKSHFEEDIQTSPLNQIAKFFSDRGFVAMTYSKRGSGTNSDRGQWIKSSFSSENQDAQAALDYLKTFKNVDAKQIYVFGQSIGCLHAALLAQKNELKGAILFAGAYRGFDKTFEEQNLDILEIVGTSRVEGKKKLAPFLKAVAGIKKGSFSCAKDSKACSLDSGTYLIEGTPEKYLVELLKIDPISETAKLKIPTLVLQGTSDVIISEKEFEAAKLGLKGKANFSFVLLDKVDHFMKEAVDKKLSLKSMSDIQGAKAFPPIASSLTDAIRIWLPKEN